MLPSPLTLRLLFGAFYFCLSNNDILYALILRLLTYNIYLLFYFVLSTPTYYADEIENLKLEQARMGMQCADAQRREKILMRRLANKEQEFQDYVVNINKSYNLYHFI